MTVVLSIDRDTLVEYLLNPLKIRKWVAPAAKLSYPSPKVAVCRLPACRPLRKLLGKQIGTMVFTEPGFADRFQPDQRKKFSLDGIVDAEGKQPLFHRLLERQENPFLEPQMKRPVRASERGVFPARHSGL